MELKLSEFKIAYKNGGLKALREEVEFNRLLNRDRPFYVRIADNNNQTILSSVPETWKDFQFTELGNFDVDEFTSIRSISSPERNFDIEIMTNELDESYIVQVGGSTRVRKEILQHALTFFFAIIIPTNIILMIWIAIFSSRLLQPINNMISFVKQIIHSGDYSKTLSVQSTTAELEEFTTIFNTMLKNTQSLIERLRSVLDSLAHDIRTPITKIRATAELSLEKDKNIQQAHKSLAVCIEESSKLIQFTKSILELSEVEYGMVEIKKENTDIVAIIKEVVEVYRFIAEDKNITIRMLSAKELFFSVDEIRFKQSVSNILDNAVKYSPEHTTVFLAIEEKQTSLAIVIKDHGYGISEEDINHIWNRTYSNCSGKKNTGYGLGLYIAKVFIEAHGGNIMIESKKGEGSCFTISLPKK